MGTSDILPEKADTHGCLYCCSRDIHHPADICSFRSGGEPHFDTLCSKLKEFNKYLEKGILRKRKDKEDLSLRFPDLGLEYRGNNTCTDMIARNASVALRLFNGEKGSNFELVKIGRFEIVVLGFGFLQHMNFEAKNKDDPDAEVMTFFAEVIRRARYFFVDFCQCLGPSFLLPDEAELKGCCYCKCIHHPPGPGYLIGRELD
ncbi:hypothetical protein SOVF_102600 [Spinacia oleracea]|uniref:Uncharacterized protein isoform X2 n=1 Tax=Spinacia oleracea TaxID=3562 RepID=A0A9R0HUQ3_SPIOL|nr:uncharacterized protein LOC110777067 isoform X2 [Spinacia oleracea]KNA14962.1 hypothetical protein SOVF_102600 [Spinacia oleracea]